ncbi:hypothetical protein AX774_g1731 [Zancudomyces culisetae]|uniref:AB hydrolase-1 domain-containing protein n=1 Tax=Zancudomyces culisetae TaxID=1213189 RepID=A0A1R1PUV6_ZANCU|nr:hypothetical protein AX774_g1731 [Zancudomyces culisetae]|eukprot:OMH84741.1 hypothetical protein AX774_g1731 [Zancudomyces culisetae]
MPGTTTTVIIEGSNSQFDMHIWCMNPTTNFGNSTHVNGTATFVLLSEFGYPGSAMKDLMGGIASLGYKACVIDRPGYGWSQPGRNPQKPTAVVNQINQVLVANSISSKVIFVGWGDGGLYAQLYIQKYPSVVYGMALLNTYPNQGILEAFALNKTSALTNLKQLTASTSDVVYFDKGSEESKSSSLQAARVFSPLQFVHSYNKVWDSYIIPETTNLLRYLTNTNNYYQARYFEYNRSGLGLYKALLNYVTAETNSILQMRSWPLRWPSFPSSSADSQKSYSYSPSQNQNPLDNSYGLLQRRIAQLGGSDDSLDDIVVKPFVTTQPSSVDYTPATNTNTDYLLKVRDSSSSDQQDLGSSPLSLPPVPLLLMVDGMSISGDCNLKNIANPQSCQQMQAIAWFKYRQQIEYYMTLSSRTFFVICSGSVKEDNQPCNEYFVLTRPNWLASQIVTYFFS